MGTHVRARFTRVVIAGSKVRRYRNQTSNYCNRLEHKTLASDRGGVVTFKKTKHTRHKKRSNKHLTTAILFILESFYILHLPGDLFEEFAWIGRVELDAEVERHRRVVGVAFQLLRELLRRIQPVL